jgi:glycolate oxidase FAD binding subunit
MGLGSPPKTMQLVLGLKRLSRLLEHEPADLTATVEAGMTLEAFQGELKREGQWLSLDPPFEKQATLGGILSTNGFGPKRHLYGGARDLVIGIHVVSADGSLVRGGGKVVKNVAGYDLPKLYIGALGTLGVIVGLTVKLRPLPEDDGALLTCFSRIADAGSAVRALMESDLIPYAIELLDQSALHGLTQRLGRNGKGVGLLVGFDGLPEQVEWQLEEAERLCAKIGGAEGQRIRGEAGDEAWRFVREFGRRAYEDAVVQLRIGLLPTQLPAIFQGGQVIAQRNGQNVALVAHAGLGVVTAVFAPEERERGDGAAVETLKALRGLVLGLGGQLTVERAPLAVKEQVEVWDPPGAAMRIMERIKAELDPKGILNPGRFVGGL